MRSKILHESHNRIRVHLYLSYMTCEEADKLEYYLLSLSYVKEVKVNERTSDATVRYVDGTRLNIINALSEFDFNNSELMIPENTGRQIHPVNGELAAKQGMEELQCNES